uniref:Uncharacterized protein n=1 Tax=uncultured bacterium contig00016 TaxID=1181507 RepID=A0A806KLY1_9BACT|nr:hypothetical protein [uncultured bacterium contig00016]
MYRADREAELECGIEKGREEVFALLEGGMSLDEIKATFRR